MQGKATYIQPSSDPAVAGASFTGQTFFMGWMGKCRSVKPDDVQNALYVVPCKILSQSLVCKPSHTHGFAQLLIRVTSHTPFVFMQSLVPLDLDLATAQLVIRFLGPFLSALGFLFIVRIVISWYPKLPVEKFPYVMAYAPTEPLLVPTWKLIPPLGGVDATPVVWFGLISFMNEILVGPQGRLLLLSQQV
ncbi:protein COFACTOR ASSEMBLY OF COMPLEX C SUBUNIT B CCB3, chloroplastic-like [Actinidia eriantha]|uniref:protein COFACTOR ASSEMBLY OF COMPLEX C SUBUNIT B CCB3, chloroplastic-like n=1 Tax=Actinidia eriantha TaxID=165200 RepID=UPI00258C527C|nr:protein COFACTOR ASSEMBLY OF COMPLEX C SUBUNIT B CCB3, chloroplastic-like [Actinidia eriantha]XP_057461161.1 protein COFACTOR ASSEMBLY OF COMPLEX C SUBUNIT B CCB3, chloroplastic-like [Actinidia eriantha]